MNIAVPYVKDFPWNDKIAEFTVSFNARTDDYLDMIKFLELYLDKRINIELTEYVTNFEPLILFTKMHEQMYFIPQSLDEAKEFHNQGLRYFFNRPVISWDALNSFILAGVSDIYITGELGFDLDRVREVLKQANVRSRAIVNLAQADDPFYNSNTTRAFFIRPDDADNYSNFIDTFEFYHEENKYKLEVLYKVYAENKAWFGDLNEIIAGLDVKVDNKSILPEFARFRYNCGKRCYKGVDCSLCDRTLALAQSLSKMGFILERKYSEPQ